MLYSPAMKKRMIIMIIALIIVFGGIFGFDFVRSYFMGKFFAHFKPPPAVISSTKTTAQIWQPSIIAVGTLVAVNGVEVSSEASGTVMKIYFNSGQLVKQGEPLVQLDNRADLQDLKNYEANLELAKINYNRARTLFQKKAVSQSELDTNRAQLKQAQALAEKTKILISQKMIVAPFAGKIGIRQINLGQYLSPGAKIVSLQSLDPLYAQFYLPEQDYKSLYVGQPITLTVDAYQGAIFHGKITAIDAEVDSNTRNILVEASLHNKNNILVPGMFADIKVILPQEENVIVVPQTTVSYSLYGDSIFVITRHGKDKKGNPILTVKREYVKVGERQGNIIAILSGIKAGDEVVTSGQLKLEDGMRVVVNNSNKI